MLYFTKRRQNKSSVKNNAFLFSKLFKNIHENFPKIADYKEPKTVMYKIEQNHIILPWPQIITKVFSIHVYVVVLGSRDSDFFLSLCNFIQ